MLYAALWVLDQEARALAPFYHGERKQFSELNTIEKYFFMSVGMINAAGLGIMASSPYTYLWGKTTQSRMYLAEDALESRYIRTGEKAFRPSYATKGFATRPLIHFKSAGARRVASKIGSRFIPYVGWALLMVDAWNVGKFIGHKLFDDF